MINENKVRSILEGRRGQKSPISSQDAAKPFDEQFEEIRTRLLSDPEFMPKLAALIVAGVKDLQRGEPGQDGKTPERGVDYLSDDEMNSIVSELEGRVYAYITQLFPKRGEPGTPGRDAISPVAGQDYPTHKQVQELVRAEVARVPRPIPQTVINRIVERVEAKTTPETAREIAAKLDKEFKGEDRFARIRDLPGSKLYDEKKTKAGRLHRGGGGSPIYAYDLSSQCDGNTRTFTVPSHSRAHALNGTDFPVIYRPTTDWTTSGTVLTIDGAVAAPSAGATLIFEYVE
jgi:hypothetical protein